MLALLFSCHPSALAPPSAPPALPPLSQPPPPRLAAVDRALLLDGAPWLMRGVAYAPTPVGVAPGPTQSLDFFSGGSERNVRTFERDLPLLAAMGANALRVYHFDWGGGQSHARFFNACAAHNITVMGGFELHAHPDSAHSLNTTAGLAAARAALTAQLRNLAPPGANRTFPAATLWSVGNELNAPFNRFVCDDDDGDRPRNSGAIPAPFWRNSGAIILRRLLLHRQRAVRLRFRPHRALPRRRCALRDRPRLRAALHLAARRVRAARRLERRRRRGQRLGRAAR